MKDIQIIRPSELAKMLGISKVTLWRYEKRKDFPSKIQLGPRAVGYRAEDVYKFISENLGKTTSEV